ncbi:DUF397 domain-containing protein [Micromonospora sp. NPDC050417]|uniref:DUF397 domain-containing protein n=1 Tax=Micromonospora sp. NPDC050417 TaxID=3364280 RepID=UPI0037A0EBFF
MVAADLGDVVWRKSSRSGSDTNCVEIAELPQTIAVRDSKDPDGPVLTFVRSAWTSFVTDIHAR